MQVNANNTSNPSITGITSITGKKCNKIIQIKLFQFLHLCHPWCIKQISGLAKIQLRLTLNAFQQSPHSGYYQHFAFPFSN